jgi:hypothetical protein
MSLNLLQKDLTKLREHYYRNSRSAAVRLQYTGTLADVYLLAYAPSYMYQAERAFELANVIEMQPKVCTAAFFCCGPAPESVALVHLLRSASRNNSLTFHFFDQQIDQWRVLRDAVVKQGCVSRYSGDITTTDHHFDLLADVIPKRTRDVLRGTELAIFQNYSNELGNSRHDLEIAERNIVDIASWLPYRSKLVFSDLYYSTAHHRRLMSRLRKYGTVITHEDEDELAYNTPDSSHPLSKFLFEDWRVEPDRKLSARGRHTASFMIFERNARLR